MWNHPSHPQIKTLGLCMPFLTSSLPILVQQETEINIKLLSWVLDTVLLLLGLGVCHAWRCLPVLVMTILPTQQSLGGNNNGTYMSYMLFPLTLMLMLMACVRQLPCQPCWCWGPLCKLISCEYLIISRVIMNFCISSCRVCMSGAAAPPPLQPVFLQCNWVGNGMGELNLNWTPAI